MIIIHQQYPLVEVLLVLVLVWQNSIPNVISVVEKKLLLLYCIIIMNLQKNWNHPFGR